MYRVGELNLFEVMYQEEKTRKMEENIKPLEIEIYKKDVGILEWNFDELKKALAERLKSYKSVVYDDSQISLAKKDRALLNNLRKAINSRKIEIKNEFCAPYFKFEEQAKELMALIEEASSDIDSQVKAFEQREKDQKMERIAKFWIDNGPSLQIPLDQVFDQRYLNKTCKDTDWQADLTVKAKRIDSDLKQITKIALAGDTKKYDFVNLKYLDTLDLGVALAEWEKKQEQIRIAEEYRIEAERRRQEVEQKRIEAEQAAAQTSAPEPIEEFVQEEILERVVRVWGTRQQIIELANWMKANGIRFKKA